jgi:hypothetical protein
MILFKDILTFLGLVYRDASLITLYLVVIGISLQKNQKKRIISTYKNLLSKKLKIDMFKMDVRTFWY